MHRMKRFWTDADFSDLSWHDNSVHAFRVIEGKDGAGELFLDIDHIVEWIESEKRYDFRDRRRHLRENSTVQAPWRRARS